MMVAGSAVVPMAASQLWAALSDPARIGEALPHVEGVDVHDDDSFSACARPRTGLGETSLHMDFQVLDRREGEHVRIVGEGAAGENLLTLSVELDLVAHDESSSRVSWAADVQIRGLLSSLVQRSLPILVTEQVNEVLGAVRLDVAH